MAAGMAYARQALAGAESGDDMVSMLLNVAIAVISVLAWLSVVQGRGDDRNLMTHGMASLKYFTVLSNLFSGLASAAYVVELLRAGSGPAT